MIRRNPRNFECPESGTPCTNPSCKKGVVCWTQMAIEVEETKQREAQEKRDYANKCWNDPEFREQERQRYLREEIAESQRRIARTISN